MPPRRVIIEIALADDGLWMDDGWPEVAYGFRDHLQPYLDDEFGPNDHGQAVAVISRCAVEEWTRTIDNPRWKEIS